VSDRFEYINPDLIISQFKGLVIIDFIILVNLNLKEADHNISFFIEELFKLFEVL